MNPKSATPQGSCRAADLRKLPPEQRDAVLSAAALAAENEYRNNRQLTDFEAFGKDDLDS